MRKRISKRFHLVRFTFKKSKLGSFLWKLIIGLVGGLITALGAVALIGPGPGILILLIGLGVLASEFTWAAEVLLLTKKFAKSARDGGVKGIMKRVKRDLLIAGGLILIMVVISVSYFFIYR